jgi:hypothetical protein
VHESIRGGANREVPGDIEGVYPSPATVEPYTIHVLMTMRRWYESEA